MTIVAFVLGCIVGVVVTRWFCVDEERDPDES